MFDQSKLCKTSPPGDGACCIDTYRIYDSCKNQECLEDMAVLFCDEGQRILDGASAVRVKSVRILGTSIDTEEMPFNKGFFQIKIRYFFHTVLDCCSGSCAGQEAAGLCVFDKSVLLYGGEGSVSVFESDVSSDPFCRTVPRAIHQSTNLPRTVVEVANPIALRLNVIPYECGQNFGIRLCTPAQIPEEIAGHFPAPLREASHGNKACYLSVGIFSLVRLERPAQLVIPACDSCIPSGSGEYDLPPADPCSLFRSMEFPVSEFYPETKQLPCQRGSE